MTGDSWWVHLIPAFIVLFGILNLWIVAQWIIHVVIPALRSSTTPESGTAE